MADTKKYYWLKLKKDFFKRHDIRIIEEMPNGKDYILFYLKMLLESIDHEGELRFSEAIPYNEQMLSVITNTNIDIVKSAMKVFIDLHMIEVFDDCTIYMSEVQRLIGSETVAAERKRKSRANQKLLGECDNVTKMSQNGHTEIDIELELNKELDNKVSCHKSSKANKKPYAIIIDYLNEKADTSYRASSKATQSHINARLTEGYTVDDFKTVIDKQCAKWKGTEYEQYLRPSTLFGSKFENYLNGKTTTSTSGKNDGWCFNPDEDSLDDLF